MRGGQSTTPERGRAHPGLGSRYAIAAGIPIPSVPRDRAFFKRAGACQIHFEGKGEPFIVYVKGPIAWALIQLIEARATGCTPIIVLAPRWSTCIHELRERGVPIETLYEPHFGEFSGKHGRYILRANVRQILEGERC